jgi:hypothetical protein
MWENTSKIDGNEIGYGHMEWIRWLRIGSSGGFWLNTFGLQKKWIISGLPEGLFKII